MYPISHRKGADIISNRFSGPFTALAEVFLSLPGSISWTSVAVVSTSNDLTNIKGGWEGMPTTLDLDSNSIDSPDENGQWQRHPND